ncbi:TPA: TIR domain-containing protein [Staphylococcus pseudintermedius]|uniref:TIR domain-containing protein n=1 Tax=Staphylococcus pseudintermedius TaxID=283734 RepID=UPI0011245A79|nr:TIR domain-containing protein [Staphylococcus pseudintermedius]EGQ2948427.1 hypothetical protein [Staphylococcus pseudintermedius]EGQ4208352.1 hypothetical protein [Staphylococcus pseudintermedius]EIE3606459.1 TIR domain-containing protein [Staphylococcus pseudintermedius]ELP8743278.1 TIR domain-containing protein [Staphylococcus pseudintermedius]ELV2651934.1 TIR domain-containing protein [Staphylococcus pseudintermedius]
MAYKTFISYKFDEAKCLRNEIVKSLGEDAKYYQGETSVSPDMSDNTTEYIKNKLKDMIYSTSVTIVIISPRMKQSKWIDWEIEYSLKQMKRGDRRSGTNGIVGVIQKHNGNYSWFRKDITNPDGHSSMYFDLRYTFDIISKNICNKKEKNYTCVECETINQFEGSYISFVDEEAFLQDPNSYIKNAYEKSKMASDFEIIRKK